MRWRRKRNERVNDKKRKRETERERKTEIVRTRFFNDTLLVLKCNEGSHFAYNAHIKSAKILLPRNARDKIVIIKKKEENRRGERERERRRRKEREKETKKRKRTKR